MSLVISRTNGQTIHIGDDIQVTIYTTDSKQVKVVIEAPRDVLILREELLYEAEPA